MTNCFAAATSNAFVSIRKPKLDFCRSLDGCGNSVLPWMVRLLMRMMRTYPLRNEAGDGSIDRDSVFVLSSRRIDPRSNDSIPANPIRANGLPIGSPIAARIVNAI